MAIEKGESSRVAWTWQQDKAFEVALTRFPDGSLNRWENIAANIPGHVTAEEVEHHYELLVADVAAIEAGNVTLPNYPTPVYQNPEQETQDVITNDEGVEVVQPDDRNAVWESRKGVAWSEAEHARFLLGVRRYGKGDWKSIAKDFVKTRSSTQVASHAQKHFKRHETRRKNDGKRWSIFDISADDLTDEQLRELGEEEGIVFDEQSDEQVTGLTQQGQQQNSFDVDQQEEVEGSVVQGPVTMPSLGINNEVDHVQQLMPGFNEVVRGWGIWPRLGTHEAVQALCVNLSTFATNAAGQAFGNNVVGQTFGNNAVGQTFGGINGGLSTFRDINGGLPTFGGINGGLPTYGINGGLPTFGGINGGLPTFGGINGGLPIFRGINGGLPTFRGINGGLPTFCGINGGLPTYGINGGLPTFGFNGGLPPFGINGALPPFGTNGALPTFGLHGALPTFGVNGIVPRLPTFGGNGAVQTFGTNGAGNIENIVPQGQQMSPPVSPPTSWYFDSDDDDDGGDGGDGGDDDDDDDDDDDNGGSGSGDAGNQSHGDTTLLA